ncbi:MAG: SNF2-related protein, partial [Trueperaceae bacterium]|nr:SNF2-related protein [Trueperaceae bacterium]
MSAPPTGAHVQRADDVLGVVRERRPDDPDHVARVTWADAPQRADRVAIGGLRPHLASGMQVEHVPRSGAPSWGTGTVQAVETPGGRTRALVDFWLQERRTWLPWTALRQIPPVETAYQKVTDAAQTDPEGFRLRNLAFALDRWHANTGALSPLDIDPLPHQIHVAHTILTSGNLNWMIADDVGLGKTIEVGLIVAALMARRYRRFLFVVPAGLTRQWKDELRDKFDVADAMIYGDDFAIDDARQWKAFDRVIVSIDRLKADAHLDTFLSADDWDLIIFDEAHRLGREETGRTYGTTARYRAAAALRARTEAVLLLTGTPHQGKDDKFRALLELLRPGPEAKRQFVRLRHHPEILEGLVLRNRKADVTDADGTFVFRGKDVRTVEVPETDLAADFEDALRAYVREGYGVTGGSDSTRRAIGFVMTTYRKLAASSYAAIHRALVRRAARLRGEAIDDRSDDAPEDERYVEQDERESAAAKRRDEFFTGEADRLRRLIDLAERLVEDDAKVAWLLDEVVARHEAEDRDGKLLLFTEYRTTQEHLTRALEARYGAGSVAVIHGGQSPSERRRQIDAFHADASFMISTEAGAEGINLQRACHVMVNFDLPWNPMRLVQRVGRLYRYGQRKRVQVVNLRSPASADDDVVAKMYDRLESIATNLAHVGGYEDGREGLQDDILGSLVGNLDLDVAEVLAAAEGDEHPAQERIDAAIARAQEAAKMRDDLLEYAGRYDPSDLADDLPLDVEHVKAFAEGAFARADVRITARRYGGDVWDLHLPEALRDHLRLRTNVRIAFTRPAARTRDAASFGPDHPLYQVMRDHFTLHKPDTLTAPLAGADGRLALTTVLRWNDDRGRRVRDEYVAAVLRGDGEIVLNPPDWADALLTPAPAATGP